VKRKFGAAGGQDLVARSADADRYCLCRNEEISLYVSREVPMHDDRARRSLGGFIVALALACFGLNWLWEMAQMRAYAEMAAKSWQDTLLTCGLAALGDTAVTFVVWGVGALAAADVRWGMAGRWNAYATAALLGGACAVAYEWKAIGSGDWHYTARMPVVPVLGVGLWPPAATGSAGAARLRPGPLVGRAAVSNGGHKR
jgi:hypothetical protein